MTERSEIAIHAITWVKLENIMLSEKKKTRNKRPNSVGFYLYEMSRQIHKDRK